MPEPASRRLDRIVAMVAELSRRDDASLEEVARWFGTTPAQIVDDIAALSAASGDSHSDWLSSLQVVFEDGRVSLGSLGPFRRPLKLLPDEAMAVLVGLLAEDARPLMRRLNDLLHTGPAADDAMRSFRVGPSASGHEAAIVDLAREARRRGLKMRLAYSTPDADGVSERTIWPHQVFSSGGAWYVVAWCERAGAWRHFRADRVLDATLLDEPFERRDGFEPVVDPDGVFRAAEDAVTPVQVRFSPAIARWLLERHPSARREADGSVVVTYRVASTAWLVREVLQYGDDAEVLSPEWMRGVMRKVL